MIKGRSNTTLYNKCIYRFNGPLLFLNTERFQKNALKCYKAKFSRLYSIKTKKLEVDPCSENYYLIVDASTITDIDQAGVTAIKALNEEIIKLNGVLMIAECSRAVREECHRAGLSNVLLSSSFYPTIQDAIANASLKEAEKRKSDCLCNDKF
uniref:STAS domain-containing protein n=1 Tax=Acrobeloides nanus TaxID=290746 RepID=A0A914ECN2_9BILA